MQTTPQQYPVDTFPMPKTLMRFKQGHLHSYLQLRRQIHADDVDLKIEITAVKNRTLWVDSEHLIHQAQHCAPAHVIFGRIAPISTPLTFLTCSAWNLS